MLALQKSSLIPAHKLRLVSLRYMETKQQWVSSERRRPFLHADRAVDHQCRTTDFDGPGEIDIILPGFHMLRRRNGLVRLIEAAAYRSKSSSSAPASGPRLELTSRVVVEVPSGSIRSRINASPVPRGGGAAFVEPELEDD